MVNIRQTGTDFFFFLYILYIQVQRSSQKFALPIECQRFTYTSLGNLENTCTQKHRLVRLLESLFMLRPTIAYLLHLMEEILFPEYFFFFCQNKNGVEGVKVNVFQWSIIIVHFIRSTCQFHSHKSFNKGYATAVFSSLSSTYFQFLSRNCILYENYGLKLCLSHYCILFIIFYNLQKLLKKRS